MQEINPVPGLVPYIACAAVAAFAMNYCIQSVQAGLNASDRFGGRSEAVQSMNIADRSHKGDRLPSTHRIYGQATAGSVDVGPVDPAPATVSRRTPPQSLGLQPQLPDGCESAFSPMSAAEQKNFAARCLT
jgi:hypothetical protein